MYRNPKENPHNLKLKDLQVRKTSKKKNSITSKILWNGKVRNSNCYYDLCKKNCIDNQ